MSKIPPTPHPWRVVEHEGERYMVKSHDGVVWIVSLPDRTLWLLDQAKAPAWAGGKISSTPDQMPLL